MRVKTEFKILSPIQKISPRTKEQAVLYLKSDHQIPQYLNLRETRRARIIPSSFGGNVSSFSSKQGQKMAGTAVCCETEREKENVGTILHLSPLRLTCIRMDFCRLTRESLARCEHALAWSTSLVSHWCWFAISSYAGFTCD